MLGGFGADSITTGAGRDLILGDNASATFTGGVVTYMTTTDASEATGGNDLINGGDGDNIILGGVGMDAITGAGNDVVLGDNGNFTLSAARVLTYATTADVALGGADTINAGAGNNVVLGGLGQRQYHHPGRHRCRDGR